jgi:hypothetical protein
MGDRRGAYKASADRPDKKRALERSKRKREDNIKINFEHEGWGGIDWIYLAQD